ncbi:MAG: hypothetical protein JSS02_14340 [Planctomycetes bacterium]|nr:hypothetical protein [Planctomycetota bacterium]
MNFTPEQIELIVQQVVRHLQMPADRPAPAATVPAAAALAATDTPQTCTPAPETSVHVAGRIITQDLLASSARGARTIRVEPQALLTPSAKDYIRHNQIQVVRETAAPAASSQPKLRWQIIVAKSTPQLTIAIESLASLGIAAEVKHLGVATEVAAQTISAICRAEAQQVVVLTAQPELVACLANRNEQIRAAAVTNLAGIERARRHLQANVVTVDPADRNVHELKTLLKAFRAV